MGCTVSESEKIEGFDKWDIEEDARTLIRAEEIRNGDAKKLKVILKQVDKTAKAALEAAEKKDVAARQVKAISNAGKNLEKTFGKKK